jgi:glutaryl-CoA dehydrogenase
MPAFNWSDPLHFDADLSEDERLIREAARDYAQAKLLPRIVAAFRDERFDRAIMEELG